jgi:2-C-methyl-D-erythritol 4-phosphate cytidylyltransferase
MSNTNYWLIILASGIGKRFKNNKPKQYLTLKNGLTVLDTVLSKFINLTAIKGIILALRHNDSNFKNSQYYQHFKLYATVIGGKERYHSTYQALINLERYAQPNDWVLVHDAVRPCIDQDDITKLITQVGDDKVGGILATQLTNTVKMVSDNKINKTLDRNQIYQAQTPQLFRLNLLKEALELVIKNGIDITDDAHGIELLGKPIKVVLGSEKNIKITYPSDISYVNLVLQNDD